jgi:XTP/dITP diphosphohydrolase
MIVVAATQNMHKIQEIDAITRPFGFQVISRGQAGIPDFPIEEDEETFEGNSKKKAVEIYKACGQVTVADDSGLMVDWLSGMPGVLSARFAGEEGNDEKNNSKLLTLLKGVPMEKRTAKFVSVVTMVFSNEELLVARGECEGHILYEARGKSGFGYDPLFVPAGYDLSFGELTAEEKNKISHRAKALHILQDLLKGFQRV